MNSMRILIQEARDARVEVQGNVVGRIDKGIVALVGFTFGDDRKIIERMIDKMINLRIFPDENGNTNLSINDCGGNILAVSQFTLYADVKKGNRPSFVKSLPRGEAEGLFGIFREVLSSKWPEAQYGVFHADMDVTLTNVGPFTVLLDSQELGY